MSKDLVCKKCKSENVVMVEYGHPDPYRYDGVSEIDCKDCGARFGRWTGKELTGDEQEPPYGDMKNVTSKTRHYNL